MMPQPPTILTIAGSDSGGAAGLQADLKTFAALDVYGMSAVTAVTAQNSERVEQVRFLSPELVIAQIDAVLSDYGASAVKTGFIGRADLVAAVAGRLRDWQATLQPFILVDPVLVNHRGEAMFAPEVTTAYREHLFQLADLVTPNRHEAAMLAGLESWPDDRSTRSFKLLGARQALVKGLPDDDGLVDVLWDGADLWRFPHERINTGNVHGSGDTLSAAICAGVAQGLPLPAAVRWAQAFTVAAIRLGAEWQLGRGHGPLDHAGSGREFQQASDSATTP